MAYCLRNDGEEAMHSLFQRTKGDLRQKSSGIDVKEAFEGGVASCQHAAG